MKKKGLLFSLAIVSIALIISSVVFVVQQGSSLSLQIARVTFEQGETLFMETANTLAQKTKGLSGSREVPRDGLLFIYKTPEDVGIWMKEMNYPIDIVWVADGKVVHIVENAQPDDSSNREVYRAGQEVSYVLEMKAETIQELGISLGDQVEINGNQTR